MANLCLTEWAVTGDKHELDILEKYLREAAGRTKHKFCDLYYVYRRAGLKDDNRDFRSDISSDVTKDDNGTLRFCTEDSWGPKLDVVLSIKTEAFPHLKFYFQSEESGNGYFGTNDLEFTFFKNRFIIDFYNGKDCGIDYAGTEEELCKFINDFFPKAKVGTWLQAKNYAARYNDMNENTDRYLYVNMYEEDKFGEELVYVPDDDGPELFSDDDLENLSDVFHDYKDYNRDSRERVCGAMRLEDKLSMLTHGRYEPDTTYDIRPDDFLFQE